MQHRTFLRCSVAFCVGRSIPIAIGAFGVAFTDDNIYFVQYGLGDVTVCNGELEELFPVHIPGMNHPHGGFLYITDNKRHNRDSNVRPSPACIWKIRLPLEVEGHQLEADQLSSEDTDFSPFALSLSHDGRIIVTTRSNSVFVYLPGQDSSPIKHITCRETDIVRDIEHVVHLSGACYMLIQCSTSCSALQPHQILKFERDEDTSSVLLPMLECKVEILRPGHLALFSCSNNVAVADRTGNAIIA